MKNDNLKANRFAARAAGAMATVLVALMLVLAVGAGPGQAAQELGCAEKEAKAVVHAAALGLGALLKDLPDERARIELMRKFIEPIRFYPDNSGYFYVYTLDCVNVAHAAQKNLVGKNLRDHKDCRGKYAVREAAETAKKGGGFFDFHWARPGVEGEHLKRGYVEPIPGFNYFIGSGLYLENQ